MIKIGAYLKHRVGFALFTANLTYLFIVIFEYRLIQQPTEWALFFWGWSAISLLIVPLTAASSWKDALFFFAYFSPLAFLLGLIALIVPSQLAPRFQSVLAITWTIIYILLKRRKPEMFDWKVGIHPLMFLETIIIWGLSFLGSYIIVFTLKLSIISPSLSPFANYMLLMFIFYIMLSITATILRYLNITK